MTTEITSSPVSDLDLATPEGVQTYLSSTPFACTRVEVLTGGGANYVFRVHLAVPFGDKALRTVVLKHGKGYVRSMRSVAFDTRRQYYEVYALRKVRAWLDSVGGGLVTVPEVYLFDEEAHVIVMDDAGEGTTHLKNFMQIPASSGGPTREMAIEIGKAVGRFLGGMHVWGKGDAELLEVMGGYDFAKRLAKWYNFDQILHVIEHQEELQNPKIEVGEAEMEVLREVVGEMGKGLAEAKEAFVMGDFWPGNMLVVVDSHGRLEKIVVVDWEMSRTGLTGVEVGQFCAEIHLLGRCFPSICEENSRLVLEHFFAEYVGICGRDGVEARRALVKWGGHMIILGKIWGNREVTRELVLEGIKLAVEKREFLFVGGMA